MSFNLSDDGATMIVFFNRPTSDEIEQFKAEKSFEIRFVERCDYDYRKNRKLKLDGCALYSASE